jgi:hypothetical protein
LASASKDDPIVDHDNTIVSQDHKGSAESEKGMFS